MVDSIELKNIYRLPYDLQNLIFEFYNPYKDYYSRYVLFQFKMVYIKCDACGFLYNSSIVLHHNKFCYYHYLNREDKRKSLYRLPNTHCISRSL